MLSTTWAGSRPREGLTERPNERKKEASERERERDRMRYREGDL